MSKLVIDLMEVFKSIDEIDDDFEVFVLSIEFDESGEVTSNETTEAVNGLDIDSENQECLFKISPDEKTLSIADIISIADIKKQISSIDSGYLLCSAFKQTAENSSVSNDKPIIGFGENIDLKRFFLVFCPISLTH